MQTLRFLFANLDRFQRVFWTLLLIGALDGASSFSVPILLAEFTRAPLAPDLVSRVVPLIAAALCASIIFQWCLRSWGESLAGWFGNELRIGLFCRAERLSIDAISRYHSGYLASLINQVAGSVGGLSSTMVWLLGHLVAVLTLFMFFTARESVTMAFVNLALLSVFVTVGVFLSRKIIPLADARNKAQASVMERFIDLLTNISTVKRLGIAGWADKQLDVVSRSSNESITRLQRFHATRWSVLHSIFFTALLSTIGFLLYQVERGMVSASILILFIAGFARVQNLAERLSELIKTLLEINAYVDTLETALVQERVYGDRAVAHLQRISCSGIVHRYDDSSTEIRVPGFVLYPGERVLISGRSGQGKSTFLSILAHQRTPLQGECLWNGEPYNTFDQSLERSFALVSQEAELFNLSLRDNLTMGASFSDKELTELLLALGLDDLLAGLPEGLNTQVGEKGLRLSAGQKQRINLARALLLKRPILLLDEPTSHLDAKSERMVVECLARLPRETTMVIVSHHGEARSLCIKEYIFQNGEMRQVSPTPELSRQIL